MKLFKRKSKSILIRGALLTLAAIGLVVVYRSDEVRRWYGETLFGSWAGKPGTNLGGVASALSAAIIGVAGAWIAALKATEAGVNRSNQLENERQTRLAQRESLESAAKFLASVRDRYLIITESFYDRNFGHTWLGPSLALTDRKEPAFPSVLELGKMQTLNRDVMNELLTHAAADFVIPALHSQFEKIQTSFDRALIAAKHFYQIPEEDRYTPFIRAFHYLKDYGSGFSMKSMRELGDPDDPDWVWYAPPIQKDHMIWLRRSEAYLQSGGRSPFHELLSLAMSAVRTVAGFRILVEGEPSETTDLFGIGSSTDKKLELGSEYMRICQLIDAINEKFPFNLDGDDI